MGKILIQANNLDMVIDTFMYIYMHPECNKQELADYCGFTLFFVILHVQINDSQ